MNIININYEKLKKEINEYMILHNDEIILCPESPIICKKPIILMNNETLKFLEQKLEQKNEYCIQNKSKTKSVPMIFGCYIAIAEWLSFGEVKLK